MHTRLARQRASQPQTHSSESHVAHPYDQRHSQCLLGCVPERGERKDKTCLQGSECTWNWNE